MPDQPTDRTDEREQRRAMRGYQTRYLSADELLIAADVPEGSDIGGIDWTEYGLCVSFRPPEDDDDGDDDAPERWHEHEEKTYINRAVVRELHRQEEYQVARWVWDLTRGLGSIDAVGEANEQTNADHGYTYHSIRQMARLMLNAAEAPQNRDRVADHPDEPLPQLRDDTEGGHV